MTGLPLYSASRGTGLFVQGFGWILLLLFPLAFLDVIDWVDLDPRKPQFTVWQSAIIFLGGAAMGAGFALGRAGGEVDAAAGTATQWWGLGSWRWRAHSESLARFHTVRVHPRMLTQGSFPTWRWCISLVMDGGEPGSGEFLLHHVGKEEAAVAQANALAGALALPLQVVKTLTSPSELREKAIARRKSVKGSRT
ncbi:MAG: hypothetical protein ACYTGX_16730 [Planctomycetota bacterium]|jgi:hypothetical protein